jgi:branched-chain amino acid transport system substrate-binding protein
MQARSIGLKAVAVLGALALLAACSSSKSSSSKTTSAAAASSGGSATAAPSCSGTTPKDLLIADIDEFSGAVNVYPGPVYNGAEIALDQINSAGGIKSLCGAKLTIQKYDTQSNPDQGVPQATKALADDPVAIIGGSQGATVLAASNVTHRKGIPWLTTALSSNQITDRGYPELFMAADGHSTADALLTELKADAPKLGLPANATVAYVYSQGTFGVSSHDSWTSLKNNPFKTVSEVAYPATTTDYSAVAARVASANADIILAGCYPADCVALQRLWQTTVKPTAKFVAVLGASTTSLVTALGPLANGLILGGSPGPGQPNLPPSFQKFYDLYNSKYGTPPASISVVFAGYVNVLFLAKALEAAGSTDPKKITAELHKVTISQDEGNIYSTPKVLAWNSRGTYTEAPSEFAQIVDGKQLLIYPPVSKQADIVPYKTG